MKGRRCTVLGKGHKRRTLPFSGETFRALWAYIRLRTARTEEGLDPESAAFLGESGLGAGQPLQRSGVQKIIRRLGQEAKIDQVRCSPHTLRHSFAVAFLRAGGNVFTLQTLLGHTNLKQTQRYLALAQADIDHQHRLFSPVESLRKHHRAR